METCLAQSCAAATAGSPMIFAQLVQTLLAAQCSLSQSSHYPPDRTNEILANPDEEYDFIVVGGGTAGSVVASRLSENENWKVLLIEVGNDPSMMSDVPALLLMLQRTEQDWDYDVEPQDNMCLGMKNKYCKWAKGKALGGSSVINAMLHVHGNKRDYDEWAKLGNPGWSFDKVLPYFKKGENYPPEILAKHGSKYFGTGGPVNIRTYNYSDSDIHNVILNAVEERGIPILDVLNGEQVIGFGKAHGTIDSGIRMNAARAYLAPVKDRKNLFVMKSARADKIILEGNHAKAVRVTLTGGKTVTVKASKEIVLSAGSISTPQILMLSGIGPKDHLEEFGINTVADLPVGENLQDHLTWLGVQVEYFNGSTMPFSPIQFLDQAYNYLIHKSGEFTTTGGADLLGFINLEDPKSKYPDIQFHHIFVPRGQVANINAIMNAFGFDDEIRATAIKLNHESNAIFMCPTLLNPKSAGQLKLRSDDPADRVRIYANYLADIRDTETLMRGLDFVKTLLETETFKKLGMKVRHLPLSGCSHTEHDSREYWECNLRHMTGTIFHPIGTARMGPSGDPAAVVDPTLMVHGIKGLRVIDASIMPNIPSGNTNSPTMMIAEKGSDMIKAYWLSKDEL